MGSLFETLVVSKCSRFSNSQKDKKRGKLPPNSILKQRTHLPLSNNARTHDDRRAIAFLLPKAPVRLPTHLHRILDATFARHRVRTPTVHQHSPDALALPLADQLPAHRHRRRLKSVLREDSSGIARHGAGDEREVVVRGVGGFDADVGRRADEGLRVAAARGYVLDLVGRDTAFAWGGVEAALEVFCEARGADRASTWEGHCW